MASRIRVWQSPGAAWQIAAACVALGIFLLAAAYRINEPLWEDGHHGYVVAEYPHNAKNFLRFGFLASGFGLALNLGPELPEEGFEFRVDHPPLSTILIGLSYLAWGIADWSARLPFIIWALAGTMATWWLARSIYQRGWIALLALVLCALSPAVLFYARLPVPHTAAVWWSMIAVVVYWRWFQRGAASAPVGVVLALYVGCWIDWYAYFIPPALAAHLLLHGPRPFRWRTVSAIGAVSVVAFASHVVWGMWLKGGVAAEQLWERFLFRTLSSGPAGAAHQFTAWQYLDLSATRFVHWLTWPVAALLLIWIARAVWRAARRTLTAGEGLIAVLLLAAVGHNLALQNRVFIHDFTMVFQLVPLAAIAAAGTLALVGRVVTARLAHALTISLAVGLFAWQSTITTRAEHERPPRYVIAYDVGRALAEAVPPGRQYVDAVGLEQRFDSFRAHVIADRPFAAVPTLAEAREFLDARDLFAAAIVPTDATQDPALVEYLARYPRRQVDGFSIFLLGNDGEFPDAAGEPLLTSGPIDLVSSAVVGLAEPSGPIPWWAWYFNRHADRLPWYRTVVHVANVWRRSTSGGDGLSFGTSIVPLDGSQPAIGEGNGLATLFPTSKWPAGMPLRERLEFEIPAGYPGGAYEVRVRIGEREAVAGRFQLTRASR